MSASNHFSIVGNIARDPEIRLTTKQTKYTFVTVGVNRIGKDKGADFIDVILWDKLADNCKKFCEKGTCVAVSGTIGVIKDKEGHNKLQLTADAFTIIHGKPKKVEETEEDTEAAKAPTKPAIPEPNTPWSPYDVDFPQ
jgi:single-strand DNA-binding protein